MDPAAFAALGAKLVSSSNSQSAVSTPPPNDAFDDILKLSALKDDARNELIEILDSLRGRKALLLDPQLAGLINAMMLPEGVKSLKDHGVSVLRELRSIEKQPSDGTPDIVSELSRDSPDNIVYLVRPQLPLMKIIAKQIDAFSKSGLRSQFHIYFVPHRTVVCEQMLEDEGVLELVFIGEFHMSFIPFEKDILSLEMDGLFKQCYVDGDTSALNSVARSLSKFQTVFGTIPHIKCKGAASRKVLQKMLEMKQEDQSSSSSSSSSSASNAASTSVNGMHRTHSETNNENWIPGFSDVDTLVIFDREIDLVSSLVTPLTYEGLVDELLGIENAKVRVDSSILGEDKDDLEAAANGTSVSSTNTSNSQKTSAKKGKDEKVTLYLNNSDVIYSEIRDTSIERLGSYLQDKAIKIKTKYSSFRDNKEASISEIHNFVKKIPNLTKEFKSLHRHINIAEVIKSITDKREFRESWQGERGMLEGEPFVDQIEDLIYSDVERNQFYKILRLLCIQSLTNGGIRTSKYEQIKRTIIQCYGFEEMMTLSNLEKAGLLKKKDVVLVDGPSVWQGLKKQLRLIEESNLSHAEDMKSVAAGYIPMLPRLIQLLVSHPSGWMQCTEIMKLLPGPLLEITQAASTSHGAASTADDMMLHHDYDRSDDDNDNKLTTSNNKRIMVIMIVGGITFLEIAAFRYLSKEPSFPYRIILATTKIINGTSLLRSLRHDMKPISTSISVNS